MFDKVSHWSLGMGHWSLGMGHWSFTNDKGQMTNDLFTYSMRCKLPECFN
ncbi:hypothetical protein LC605_29580 [Nostoc sp. CHAB 5836]|nr:hypothetical protein [Nostoc sp. CHAB 5836]